MSISVPLGLRPLLEEFTIAVMRAKPEDIVEFAATYFTQLYSSRGGQQGDAEMDSAYSGEVHMGKTLIRHRFLPLRATHKALKRRYNCLCGWCVLCTCWLGVVPSGQLFVPV